MKIIKTNNKMGTVNRVNTVGKIDLSDYTLKQKESLKKGFDIWVNGTLSGLWECEDYFHDYINNSDYNLFWILHEEIRLEVGKNNIDDILIKTFNENRLWSITELKIKLNELLSVDTKDENNSIDHIKMENTKNTQLTEIEINRVKHNFWKNRHKILNQLNEIIYDLTDKTVDDMESKFKKEYDKDLICGFVNGKIKKEWNSLF